MIFVQISSLKEAIPKIIVPKATNLSAFLLGFSFLIICLACCSCGSTKVVPLETIRDHQVHDTIVLHSIQYDSVYIYKEMDKDYRRDLHKPLTINPQPLVDTILIRQHDVEYRYKLLRDTIYKTKIEILRDSIPYEVRITEVKQVKYTPPWVKTLAIIGSITILVLLIYTFTKLKRF